MKQEIIGRDFFRFGKYAMMVTNCTKGFDTLWYPSMKIWATSEWKAKRKSFDIGQIQ